ncbi:MAG: ABC-type transport auxiliary lipoprotein family protein [Wenzhouxiangellaceae bacterium]
MNTPIAAMATAALLIMASACSILPESGPVQLLDPQLPTPEVAAQGAAWSLNVTRPESDPMRDSNRVLVRTGAGQLQVHPSARWVAAAPELLRTLLVRHLRDARQLEQVSADGSGLRRTLVLDLRRFELSESDDRLDAQIRLEARLYDSRSADLLARELFEVLRPIDAAQPAEIVSGFEAVLGEIIPALADWLSEHGASAPST